MIVLCIFDLSRNFIPLYKNKLTEAFMLGEQIKRLRMCKGLTQVEMAKIFGVTKQSVSNWENENIMPSVDLLVKIAKFFSVSTDYILGLSDEHALNTYGLSELQIAHIQTIIDDIVEIKTANA